MSDIDLAAIIAGLEATGLSRTEIANQARLSRNTVWRMAQGEVKRERHGAAGSELCQRVGLDEGFKRGKA